jgi:hypothetical protein
MPLPLSLFAVILSHAAANRGEDPQTVPANPHPTESIGALSSLGPSPPVWGIRSLWAEPRSASSVELRIYPAASNLYPLASAAMIMRSTPPRRRSGFVRALSKLIVLLLSGLSRGQAYRVRRDRVGSRHVPNRRRARCGDIDRRVRPREQARQSSCDSLGYRGVPVRGCGGSLVLHPALDAARGRLAEQGSCTRCRPSEFSAARSLQLWPSAVAGHPSGFRCLQSGP